MKDLVQEFVEAVRPLAKQLSEFGDQVATFVRENPDFVEGLKRYFENIPDFHGEIWKKGAALGWFPNWFMTLSYDTAVMRGQSELDRFMVDHITNHLDQLELELINRYEKRREILETAFNLHRQGVYIASIPLFLSQSDGICAQNIGSYLFTEHDKRGQRVSEILDQVPEEFEKILYAPMTVNTQYMAGIGKSKAEDKALAPNRSGIMHGSRKHLDYGTEINSLKCISLLAYTAYIFDRSVKA